MPTSTAIDDESIAITLGMARGKESRDEPWYSGRADNVPGELRHQDCFRWGETEARGQDPGGPQHTRVADCGLVERDVMVIRDSFLGKCREPASIGACDMEVWRPPRLWQKMAGRILDVEGEGEHQICSFTCTDNFWIMSHSKKHLEQMLKDLIEEAGKVDLEPKPASLWWTKAHMPLKRGGYDSGHLKMVLQIPL